MFYGPGHSDWMESSVCPCCDKGCAVSDTFCKKCGCDIKPRTTRFRYEWDDEVHHWGESIKRLKDNGFLWEIYHEPGLPSSTLMLRKNERRVEWTGCSK